MKKIVIASDSYKGTMSSLEVCDIVKAGILNIFHEAQVVSIPIADGGEGTVDAFLSAVGGEKINVKVKGPFFEVIESYYGILVDKKTAVIEMAAASGLPLAGENKNPLITTTYGTGQLILDALEKGCTKIIIGVGGSATNDGGIGMAAALGVRFSDKEGNNVSYDGNGMGKIHTIDMKDLDNRIKNCNIEVACDVDNPLYGKEGAAYIYAPQKGADEEMVKVLDDNLRLYASKVKEYLNLDVQLLEGAGAAGGLGAGLVAFLGAKLRSGIDIVLDNANFENEIKDADLIITGEGKIDSQSVRGKVPIGVAKRSKKYNVPVMAIVGWIDDDIDSVYDMGINSIFSINRKPEDFSVSKEYSKINLLKTVEDIMRLIKIV